MADRLAEIQERWVSEPLEGPNGENYSSDFGYLLNHIYRLQDVLTETEDERDLLKEARQHLMDQLEREKRQHATTLDLYEKTLEELSSWRQAARGADSEEVISGLSGD